MEALAASHIWLSTSLERVPGVVGAALQWPDLVSEGLFTEEAELTAKWAAQTKQPTIGATPDECSPHLTLGGCGCALSHRKAWRVLAASSAQWSLILEDDIKAFCPNFDEVFSKVIQSLPERWNMCYIGFHTGEDREHTEALLKDKAGIPSQLIQMRTCDGWLPGLWGYVITRKFAKQLLKRVVPFDQQVDTAVGSFAASAGNTYAMQPGQFLAFSPESEEGDSDVQTFPRDMGLK
eukprot:gnl/TRDRNA2_/TRDRNA2_36859_c0_seq1.p1 gnl/TRDRNA2_/TRDRNA2_36859_c0~~gnl/TRDRNA2_/TRDRNA2_36859_c0_seq1.p1  ORF type:complete len:247 (+),score=42.96 gnl/TRDRNA2_/TRDRNA2_36859_c0_seq1:34-741(+)